MARVSGDSWVGNFCAAATCCLICSSVHAQATPPRPARNVPDAPVELRVLNVNPTINVVSGAGGNVVVWSGVDGTVLVDSGLPDTMSLLAEAVTRISASPIRFVLNTHGHADHTGGNDAFVRKGATVVGHDSLLERSGRDPASPADSAGSAAPTASGRPTLTMGDTLGLHLNGDRLDVIHVADAHTSADLVMRWIDADVVALGDIYWNGQYPYIDVDSGGSVAGTVAAVEAALARANARTVIIPGHGPVSNRAELAAYRDMLVGVGRKVREGVEQGLGLEDILATKPTAEFDARFARPGAAVAPEEFVRSMYRDLAPRRPSR